MSDTNGSGLPRSGGGAADDAMAKDAEIGQPEIVHQESNVPSEALQKGLPSRDLDVAMALFDRPEQIHEPRDPVAERKLVRKIDLMILPYLAVCYAFFYIDKTTLSYAGEGFYESTPETYR